MSDIEGLPSTIDLVAFVRDPKNHDLVMLVVRREARIDREWFAGLLRREARIQGRPLG